MTIDVMRTGTVPDATWLPLRAGWGSVIRLLYERLVMAEQRRPEGYDARPAAGSDGAAGQETLGSGRQGSDQDDFGDTFMVKLS